MASSSIARGARDPLVLPGWTIALVSTASLVAAVLFPLLTYSLTLAAFGIAHVVAELRYVDQRFTARTPRAPLLLITALLAGVVVARLLSISKVVDADTTRIVELLLVCALAAVPLPMLLDRGGARAATGLLVSASLVVALAVSPLVGMLALAVVHNATPVGFLVESAPPARRLPVLTGALAVFVGVPALIATGLPAALADALALRAPEASILDVGALADHLSVYLPPAVRTLASAEHIFSGIVFAQCMHYLVVIHVLPRFIDDGARPIVRWPSPRVFVALLILVSGAFLIGFTRDFGGARSVYGVFAAVHAWIEIPILLYALVLPSSSSSSSNAA